MGLGKFFDAAFVLTALSFQSRHKFVAEQIKKLDMVVEFFFGFDGSDLLVEELARYPKLDDRGRLGNGLTHYHCWLHCLHANYKSVLLLEDDIFVNEGANEILANVMTNVPKDWTIIHVGVNRTDDPYRNRRPVNEYIMRGDNEGNGAWAYALSRKGIQFLVSNFAPDWKKREADGMTCMLTAECERAKWESLGSGYVAIPQAFRHVYMRSEIGKIRNRDLRTIRHL